MSQNTEPSTFSNSELALFTFYPSIVLWGDILKSDTCVKFSEQIGGQSLTDIWNVRPSVCNKAFAVKHFIMSKDV